MKILAGSIVEATTSFLHAGYISAYPRPLDPYQYPIGQASPSLQLDLTEALRLKGEALAGAAGAGDSGGAVAAYLSALSEHTAVLVGLCCFVVALAAGYLLGSRSKGRRSAGPVLAAASVLCVLGAACDDELEPLPTHPPWEGVTLQEYEHPELATQALLYGIIADGIVNVGQPIDILPNIQNEVGLPKGKLTSGEAYALQTYGIDGWGRELRLTRPAENTWTVTSAGADGSFDTDDDLSLSVSQCNDEDWDSQRRAFFITKNGAEHAVAFHRWTGELFEYRNGGLAEGITGSVLFDVFTQADLDADQKAAAVAAAYDEVAAGLDHEPLILQVF